MIYEVAHGFVISSGGSWLPGCYESKAAARYAYQFPNETLVRLRNESIKRHGPWKGIITSQDLKGAKNRARLKGKGEKT